MKKITAVSILFCCLFTNSVWAGEGGGLIHKVYVIDGGSGGPIVLAFSTETHTNGPACNTAENGLEWAISLDKQSGRAMMSTVLAAQAQGLQVSVAGAGVCDDWLDRERPIVVMILKS